MERPPQTGKGAIISGLRIREDSADRASTSAGVADKRSEQFSGSARSRNSGS